MTIKFKKSHSLLCEKEDLALTNKTIKDTAQIAAAAVVFSEKNREEKRKSSEILRLRDSQTTETMPWRHRLRRERYLSIGHS